MRVPRRISPALALCFAAGLTAAAQETPEAYLELLRSDIRTSKVEILTEALQLNEAEGEVFWPIYREYDTALAELSDRRIALIKSFATSHGTMTDEQISSFAKEAFSLQHDRLKLRKKYHDKVAKAVSARTAAQFAQVDNVIAMLIDLQIAAELPLIE